MADISKSGAVIAGEASESDDDVDVAKGVSSVSNEEQAFALSAVGTVISGEASESDDESNVPLDLQTALQVETATAIIATNVTSSLQKSVLKPTYNSLLHKKLREANCSMRERIDGFMRRRLDTTSRHLKSTAQQMASSQIIIQEISNTMRLVTNDLFQLEDKVDIVTACNILPDIRIPVNTN